MPADTTWTTGVTGVQVYGQVSRRWAITSTSRGYILDWGTFSIPLPLSSMPVSCSGRSTQTWIHFLLYWFGWFVGESVLSQLWNALAGYWTVHTIHRNMTMHQCSSRGSNPSSIYIQEEGEEEESRVLISPLKSSIVRREGQPSLWQSRPKYGMPFSVMPVWVCTCSSNIWWEHAVKGACLLARPLQPGDRWRLTRPWKARSSLLEIRSTPPSYFGSSCPYPWPQLLTSLCQHSNTPLLWWFNLVSIQAKSKQRLLV